MSRLSTPAPSALLHRLSIVLLVSAFVMFAPPAASAQRGGEFHAAQDWKSEPPSLNSLVQGWVDWVHRTQAGEYERTSGPPVSDPVPPGFPSDVSETLIRRRGGSYSTTSGSVTCWTDWIETHVWLRFSDGSEFFWHDDRYDRLCSDWSGEVYHQVIGSGGYRDATSGTFRGSSRSYTRDAFNTQRKASFRASAGTQLRLARPSIGTPILSQVADLVDITVGPGGVLDLRDQPPGSGPLVWTSAPVTIRCDTILLDPGVVISDLFQPPPIVMPSAIVHEVKVLGAPAEHVAPAEDIEHSLYLVNLGNVPETAQFSWSDSAGWIMPGGTQVSSGFGAGKVQVLDLTFGVPPAVQVGEATLLATQAILTSTPYPPSIHSTRVDRVGLPTPPTVYCSGGWTNGAGRVSSSGAPTLGGDDDFVIAAHSVPPSKDALFVYGLAQASPPFHPGMLCVGTIVARGRATPYPAIDGPGTRRDVFFFLGQSELERHHLLPGMQAYGQFLVRPADPHSPPMTSEALAFTIGP